MDFNFNLVDFSQDTKNIFCNVRSFLSSLAYTTNSEAMETAKNQYKPENYSFHWLDSVKNNPEADFFTDEQQKAIFDAVDALEHLQNIFKNK